MNFRSICHIIIINVVIVSSSEIECESGFFILRGMSECHPWLTCKDIPLVNFKELIGFGAVKAVYRAEWGKYNISISLLNNPDYKSDFLHNLEMLKAYSASWLVVQLIGFCEHKFVLMTEYHKLGDANNLVNLLNADPKRKNNPKTRVGLCLNYVLLLDYLHRGPAGTRVLCDSNSLQKLLSQLLITDRLNLILNDLDALPEVNRYLNKTVKCGSKEIKSDFVAPEQRWKLPGPFNDSLMPGYGEETDIWKVPSVCSHIVGDSLAMRKVKKKLYPIHAKCRNLIPERRPKAVELVSMYLKVLTGVVIHDEL